MQILYAVYTLFLFGSIPFTVGWSCNSNGPGHVSQPSLYQSPRFRWWWPNGWIDPDEVQSEIKEIIDAGFGGGEISDVEDSVTIDVPPQIYGWAQPRWNAGVLRAYQWGNKLGGHVDMTIGPHWPTGFPGYTPDSPSTSKELVHGQVFIQAGATFSGMLPLPLAAPSGNETGNPNVMATPYLATVLVAKTSTTNESASVVDFNPSSVQVITNLVKDNNSITWTAPSDGTYVLVAAYGRGTGQIQNMYDGNPTGPKLTWPWPAYIVDHFSSAGVQAGVEYWDEHLVTLELRPLLPQSQGSIFEDSLELKLKQYWTLDFLKQFQTRRGYDLAPFILYVLQDTNTFSGDATTATQITNDFYQTVSDLYIGYRILGIKQWANSIGLKLRLQPYTISADSAYAASVLDIPEGESLGFQGDNDAFRVLATGRDIAGRTTILSDELGAYMGEAYGVTWRFLLGTSNLDMSLGVSQVVIHGHPYRDSPSSLWPGFAPFTPLFGTSNGFADAWGRRQPQWLFAHNASAYLANAQKILQDGGPSTDVAILNQAWGVTASWSDMSLNDAGYSYQYPTPELLSKYQVSVQNGRLAPNGPNYQALVINETSMDVSTAQMLLAYGESGLPIIVVGATPNITYSYTQNLAAASVQLSSLFSQIQSLRTTKSVPSTSDVPAALQSLGIQPSVQYPQGVNNSLITHRRTMDSGYLYWVYNNGDALVSEAVQFGGSGAPYWIDLWSGNVSPIPSFTANDGYVATTVTLQPSAAAAIYVGPTNPFGVTSLSDHITSTDCDSYVDDTTIHLQSNVSCTATAASGKQTTLSADSLPAAFTPSSWTLSVQDWAPAQVNETALNSSLTVKTELSPVQLTTLVPWPNITSLEYASGIGVYNTTVSLNKSSDVHVLLEIGAVDGTYGIKINGITINYVDQFVNAPVDITNYVVDGDNEITITVATTLWNKLIKVWPALYGSEQPQLYGLTGPVILSYVKDVVF